MNENIPLTEEVNSPTSVSHKISVVDSGINRRGSMASFEPDDQFKKESDPAESDIVI